MTTVKTAIGIEYIFSCQSEISYPQSILELLQKKSLTLATAESCTGGLIGELLTDVPGSSDSFLGGVISYSNEAKMNLLSVDPILLEQHGAVSRATAALMAEGARSKFGADIGVSVTGIAGPTGGSSEKPVGTFHTALATAEETRTFHFCYGGSSRVRVRKFAAHTIFDLIRRHLLKHPLNNYAHLVPDKLEGK